MTFGSEQIKGAWQEPLSQMVYVQKRVIDQTLNYTQHKKRLKNTVNLRERKSYVHSHPVYEADKFETF